MEAHILRPGDERILATIGLSVDGVSMSPTRCRDLLADSSFVAAAAVEREPIGLAYGHVLKQLNRDALLLYSIGVAEAYRRRGVARALMDKLKEFCAARNLYEMWVPTAESNQAAMNLYRGAGGVRANDDEAIWVFPTPA